MPIITIPIKYRDEYIAITKRINDAKTEKEHRDLETYRRGFVEAGRLLGVEMGHIFMEADMQLDDGAIACCGVLLDWEATDAP